jgi:hypothetical protein
VTSSVAAFSLRPPVADAFSLVLLDLYIPAVVALVLAGHGTAATFASPLALLPLGEVVLVAGVFAVDDIHWNVPVHLAAAIVVVAAAVVASASLVLLPQLILGVSLSVLDVAVHSQFLRGVTSPLVESRPLSAVTLVGDPCSKLFF